MRPIPLHAALSALAIAAASVGLATTGTGTASAATAAHPMPAHVFAPYYEMYDTGTQMVRQSQKSGAKYLSLAFLQTATAGSCTAYWDGSTSKPIAYSSYGGEIATIQAAGGQVVPSFGGYSADTTGTDIADSCTDVASIAAVYEKVITTYHVTRIDLDVEANSLTDTAGINRRNEAIAMVGSWAKSHGRRIQFSYTMPSTTTGLDSQETPVLQNAIADGAKVSLVNIMTFDYYLGTTPDFLVQSSKAL
jgi:GH18 family chitinase